MSTQEEKILNQIEFYFSDSNLPNDRYLRSLVADHPEGYVEIKIIASFTRLKNLTTDLTEIVKAIKQSKVLECDKDEKFVRRVTPLPEDPDNDQRTVSLVGVDKNSTIDSITNAYSKYGKILCVRVYKDKKTHEPNGIASIEFSTVDEAKKFCEMKFDGIEVKSKQNFFEEKKKALKENKQKAQTEKKMKEINELKEKYKYTEGSLVKITNIGREKEVTFNEFNELVKSKAEVNYVDFPLFTVDPTTAIIRSKGIDESKKLLEAFKDQKLGGSEKECTIEIMKEEDVENYLIQVVEQNKKKLNQKGGKKGQRGGKKGGRGQKRKNDKGGDDRKNKKQKTEDEDGDE